MPKGKGTGKEKVSEGEHLVGETGFRSVEVRLSLERMENLPWGTSGVRPMIGFC